MHTSQQLRPDFERGVIIDFFPNFRKKMVKEIYARFNKQELYDSKIITSRLNWIAIDKLIQPLPVTAKIRYLHPGAEALVVPVDEDHVRIRFNEPQLAITPGQAIVFYCGDTVIGGGVIERAVDCSLLLKKEK